MFITAEILATAPSSVSTGKTDQHQQPANILGRLLIIIFLFVFLFPLFSHAAPIAQINDKTEKIRLDQHVDILDNPDNTITVAQLVNSSMINRFAPVDISSRAALENFSYHFWLRFSVTNNTNHRQTYWLHTNQSSVKSLSVYEILSANPKNYRIIADAPVHNKQFAPFLKEISVEANTQTTYLMQMHTVRKHSLVIELLTPNLYIPETSQSNQFFSFGLGILYTVVIILTFFAIIRRSLLFIYYSSFVLACAWIETSSMNFPRIWFPDFPEWHASTICILSYLSYTSVIKFTQEYLKTGNIKSRIWNYLNYAQYFNFWFTLGSLFFIDEFPSLTLIPLIISVPLIAIAMHQCYITNNDKIALYININTLLCSLIFTYIVFSKTNIFSMDLFFQPTALLLIIIETTINALLLIAKSFDDAVNDEKIHNQNLINNKIFHAQTEIISQLSNEFRTPISGILGMAELLKSSSLTAEQHGKVDSIKNAANILLNTVSDMHYHAQLKQNTAAIRQSPFELRLLLETCILNIQAKAESHSIELILNIQTDVPAIVSGDELRLRQILNQLLDNAVKNTRQGEVILKVSTLASDASQLMFSIRDTGSGIAEHDLRRLDSPKTAYQLNTEQHGLPSAQELLQQLNSNLYINSKEGEGSELTFNLFLPSSGKNEIINKPRENNLKYKRLLIVDDNLTYSKVLKQQTSQWGMQVTTTNSGNEAIAMYRAKHNLGETFDAIIIDYDMPTVSGIEVAEKISMEAVEPPVIIMLCGLLQSPPEHIARQAGIDVILNKPTSENLLKLSLANQFHIRKRVSTEKKIAKQKKIRVLVAEDNDVMRSVISKMMDNLPVEYTMVSDGKLAVEAAKKAHFDVILMDCEMPFLNGFDATRQIHQWQLQKHQPLTPVIALTAYTLGEHKKRSIAAGMVNFLEKPINLIELETLLQSYYANGEDDA